MATSKATAKPKPKAKPKKAPARSQVANAPKRVGRPNVITPKVAEVILERMANGETLTEICRSEGMPGWSTVFRTADADPQFRDGLARAREAQAHRWAQEIVEIADDGTNDFTVRMTERGEEVTVNHEHISRSKLRVDTRKWLLSKALPKLYGDHADAPGTADNPLTLLIQEVQGRAFRPVQTIQGEAEEA